VAPACRRRVDLRIGHINYPFGDSIGFPFVAVARLPDLQLGPDQPPHRPVADGLLEMQ